MKEFDVTVIGSGPGGYVAAVRAAQLGFKTAIIEKRSTLGGTCLNVGCIPSKALLESSEHYQHALHKLSDHGVNAKEIKLDLEKMLQRKDKVVKEVCDGVEYLMNKNKIEVLRGTGKFSSANEIVVTADGKEEKIKSKHTIIATGSAPIEIPGFSIDGKQIISSDHAINLPKVPKHLIVIGAGVIGLELGSVWSRLGAKVSIVELMPRLLGTADKQMAGLTQRILESQGLQFYLEHKVVGCEKKKDSVIVKAQDSTGKAVDLEGDVVLLCVGRRPYTDGLGAKEIGVEFTPRNRIKVNPKNYQTSVPGVYAIGDVIDGSMLAHKAEDEGIAIAEILAGQHGHVNYEAIPYVIYTWPEVAWVGYGEEELKEKGIEYNVGKAMFKSNGKSKAMNESEGQVKVLADKKTDKLLGVYIVGPRASDLIAEVGLAFEYGASAEDLARTCHAHPTLSEVLREAAMAVGKWSIHS